MTEYIYNTIGTVVQDGDGFASYARKRIVRCRDCINYEPDLYKHFNCELLTHYANPDDFCSWGELK